MSYTYITSDNWHVSGHQWAVDYLQKSMQNQRTRHAYLVAGPAHIGKTLLAVRFMQALNCTSEDGPRPCGECRICRHIGAGYHADLMVAEVDDKTGSLRIDAVRDVVSRMALRPFEARYRIALFPAFDRASGQVQDALLKTLEEPPDYTVLILVADDLRPILPTITSRSQMLKLRPVPTEQVRQTLLASGASADDAHLLSHLSGGRVGWALDVLQDRERLAVREEALTMLTDAVQGSRKVRFDIAERLDATARKDRASLTDTIEMWQSYWRDVLHAALGSQVAPGHIDREQQTHMWAAMLGAYAVHRALLDTRDLLQRTLQTNARVQLAVEAMMLNYPFI